MALPPVLLAGGVEHIFEAHGGLPRRLAGLPTLGCRDRRRLGGRDEPVAVALRRLVGLALVVLLVLLPAALAGRLRRGNRLSLPASSSATWIFMAESALAYLSVVTLSAAMVAGSERKSFCLRRVPSRHLLTKYWIT